MDNLTHTLTAIAISQTGLNRRTRFATWTLVLGANLPDIDAVAGFKDSLTYLKYHRGITHSFAGVIALAIILWGLMSWMGKRIPAKSGPPLNPRWLLLAALLGTGSHLLLDFTNSYGVRLFLPFSSRWYAWDIMFIFDPVLLLLLILGLGVPWLLRLISEEVGARKGGSTFGAAFCLAALVAVWGIRDFAHRRALSILDARTYSGESPQRFSALPVPANPFEWRGVVETEASFQVVDVDALDANASPEDLGRFDKPPSSPALSAALKTPGAKVFLNFARFPWAHVDEREEGYQVSVQDLRFYRPSTQSRGFTLEVELDKNLVSRDQRFYFNAPPGGGRER